jgi:hypothetical protein
MNFVKNYFVGKKKNHFVKKHIEDKKKAIKAVLDRKISGS